MRVRLWLFVLLVGIGLVINVISTTGIGNTFSLMVSEWASGNILIAIVLIGLASLVLKNRETFFP